jgi:protoporphyrin/coproporphyrin ferrochelatase
LKVLIIFFNYSATSGSSFNSIYTHYKNKTVPKNIKFSMIDRWASEPLLAKTFASRINDELAKFPADKRDDVLLLFSAHSIPLRTVNRGDAYPSEVGTTVHMVMKDLNYKNPYSLVWQSKVGPLPWLEPFTDDAIKAYVKQGKKNFILIPIAFVNEHIETLHELDIEYCLDMKKELKKIEQIERAAAPNDHPLFINALTDVVVEHMKSGVKISPKFQTRCPHCVNPKCGESKKWFKQQLCN